MKKTLSLLLVLAMLATMGTVPVFAEDEISLDLPLIEEVTEEELEEELELFGEIAEGETSGETNVPNVSWNTFVPAENDGVTYFTEMEGSSVSKYDIATGLTTGNIDSLINGIYTTGVEIENPEKNSLVDHYPKINGATEGFMGKIRANALTIDFGAEKTFAGIRFMDSHKARAMKARKLTKIYASTSADGITWGEFVPLTVATARGADYASTYSDFFFSINHAPVNLTAKYLRVYGETVNSHAEYDIEEIIMLDAAEGNKNVTSSGFVCDYYADVANWTWDAKAWTSGTQVSKLYDGVYYGDQDKSYHSPTGQASLNDSPITIMFDEPLAVGGVRIYPRTINGGATPGRISIQGTYDGETWFAMVRKAKLNINPSVEAPGSAYVHPGRDTTPLAGIRVLIDATYTTATTGHTCFTELEVLKPVTPRSPLGSDEVTMGYPIGNAHVYRIKGETISETRSDAGYIIYDGIYLTREWFQELGGSGSGYTDYQIHNDFCISGSTADSVYIEYDLGKVYDFSGIRLYQRVNGNQNFKEGYISVSEDGINWTTSDKITISPAVISAISDVKFGGIAYNMKTRYIKIHCTASQAGVPGHWAFEEVRLLKADDNKATKTAAEIQTMYDNAVSSVTSVIDKYEVYDITLDNADEVLEAKSFYDNLLNDAQRETVDGDKLAKLYNAAAELTHTVKVNVASTANQGERVHAGQIGFATVDYKLYLEEGVTVTGLSYDGKEISNTEWKTGAVAADGSTTLTLGGRYFGSAQQNRLANHVVTGINNGLTHGHYSKTTGVIGGFTTTAVEITEDTFSGRLVREITMNKIGDNIITLTLSDGTTRKINLVSEYQWVNVPTTATLGSKDTDAIAPSSSWRFATNLYSGDNVSFRGSKFFDGDYAYDNYSATFTSPITEYAADGSVSKNHSNNHIAIAWVNGVWLDFGAPTTFAGVRMHMKETGSCFFYEGEVYGTNDFDGEWTLLGTATSGGTRDMTINFGENVTYQYIRVVMPRYGTEAWNRLVEIAVLAPGNHLTSSDVVAVDTMSGSDAEFTFDVMEGEEIVSFKDAENADVAYTLENGTIKIANAYLNTLANGEYTFTVKFTNEQTFTLKVTKSDSSKVNYRLYGNNNSNDLVLKNVMGKTVSAVTVVNGDVRADVAFIQADDTITVKRQLFRRATDLYSTMDVDKAGKVNVEVKFDDDSVATYEVAVEAEWVTVPSTGVTATYAQDEIAPSGWKVRISSGSDINAGPFPLIKAPYGKRDSQNWHTYFGGISGTTYGDSTTAIGHYFELDFGENPEAYNGIRHLERAGGSTWNVNVTITAKNEGGQWVEIYNAKPTYTSIGTYTDDKGTVHRYQGDMLFAEPVTYRYVRIHMRSTNSHITADNIKVLKETARLTSAATVTGDINEAEDAKFTFYVPAGATVTSVTNGDAVVDASSYTLVDGVLTIKADYIATLGESTTLTATIGGMKFDLTIIRKDIYSVTYVITSAANVRGTNDLELVIPEGKVPTGITYGDKTLAVDPEVIPARLVVGEKSLTIKRYAIRDLDDIFDKTEMKITVNFEDETSKEYTVTLTKEGRALTGLNTGAFLEDEILPAEGAWTITASPSNGEGEHINNAFAKKTNDYNWHSAYSEAKNAAGNTIAMQDSTTSRLYIDVDFGTETSIGGLRYYERKNHDSGLWNGVSIYGKDAAGNWVLLKSQSFDTEALKLEAAGVVDVYFAEMVKYKEVRIIIDTTSLSTAHAITFLDSIPEAEIPEEKVNVQVTPSTGGNVTVNDAPTQGDNFVPVNEDVTFTAEADVTGEGVGFMYWVEANTGKILGTDATLTVKATSGKDIKAVFADPANFEVFVSFFGRNASAVVAHSYVKKGEAPIAPAEDKLYTTGYKFKGWATEKDATEGTMEIGAVNAATSFYAVYEAKAEKGSKIEVVNGKITGKNEDGFYAYDTSVKVTANVPTGKKFSHWKIGTEIVSYDNPYRFFAPDQDITIEAVFVDEAVTVDKKLNITMVETYDEINGGIKVVSFLTTRYIPDGVEVLETGVIYVKDASLTGTGEDNKLCIADIGKKSTSGKAVKIATASKESDGTYKSGQYKLTASYAGAGIKAVGFITYLDGETVKTIYTNEIVVPAN